MSCLPKQYTKYSEEALASLNTELEKQDCPQGLITVFKAYEKWVEKLQAVRYYNNQSVDDLVASVSLDSNIGVEDESLPKISSVFEFVGYCKVFDNEALSCLQSLNSIREGIRGFLYISLVDDDLVKIYSIIVRNAGFLEDNFPATKDAVYALVFDFIVDSLWLDLVHKAESSIREYIDSLKTRVAESRKIVTKAKKKTAAKKKIKVETIEESVKDEMYDSILEDDDGLEDCDLEDVIEPRSKYATREEMIEEAVARLREFGFSEDVVDAFYNGNIMYRTPYYDELFMVCEDDMEIIKEVEKEHGFIVYYILRGFAGSSYDCCLYVHKYKNDWNIEHDINNRGIASIYGISYDGVAFSEYSSMYIKKDAGSVTENTDFKNAILYGR